MRKTNKIYKFLIAVSCLFAFSIGLSSCKSDPAGSAAPPTIPAGSAGQTSAVPTGGTPAATAPVPTPEPGMPDQLGLYVNENGVRKLIRDSHTADWTAGQDIKCYEAVASREASLTGANFAEIWNTCWNKYTNTKRVKIGYHVDIRLKTGETISYDVKTPEDTKRNREYVETYLYDDVHQTPGQWYSHLETGDLTEETIATSIKFTAGNKIGEIEKIRLAAYFYTADLPDREMAQCEIDLLHS
ncbi:MAG: hypothetical protein ACLSVG_03865 [Clostridia bacterium]